ncbi:MAG TPA: hypothetical protein VFC99_01310 [Acidimicrobiia bacterium]|nr:hypothetical protein [Acidimicrobiia bacterium]
MTRIPPRVRRVLVVLGAVAIPVGVFAIGYAITGAGAATAPTDSKTATAAPADDGLSGMRDFYAKLPQRIGIVGRDGKPVGWADKDALEPPELTSPFDPAAEKAWYDKLVPVVDDSGNLVGYYLGGYGFVDRATGEDPRFDADALRASAAPLPPGPAEAAPSGP